MRATFTFPVSAAQSSRGAGSRCRDLKRLILSSVTSETAFAFCRDSEAPQPGGAPASLSLHHRSEEFFGVLAADASLAVSGYSVITQKGSRIYIRFAAKDGSLNVTDDSGRLL